MNSTERNIYDKYAYDKTFKYIWHVYSEFERRVNSTDNEYDGLKKGECRFDYSSWEKRLDLSHWQMNKAIKTLIKDECIEQRLKGKKGTQSTYFLTRFNLEFDQQKNQQNYKQKEQQNKSSNFNGLEGVDKQKEQQNYKQETVQSSIYNNLNIKSNINNIYSPLKNELCYEEENKSLEKDLLKQVDNSLNIKNKTDVIAKKNVKLTQFKWKSKEYEEAFKEIWAIYPNKRGIANAKKSINKLLDHYSKDELMRAVKRYDSECKGKEIKYIKIGSTFFNSGYEDYLDENYISLDTSSTKKEYKPKSDNFD